MQLSKIRVRNYRLLVDTELEIDSKTTLIVGRNNTGKTSCLECIDGILKGAPFSFNDYPLKKREKLCSNFLDYMAQSISFEGLCNRTEPISVDFTVDYSMDDPEENLGALSAFIIDIDMDITTALIRVEYKLKTDERVVQSILGLASPKKCDGISIEDARYIIENNFQKLFETVIYAINPRHPEEKQRKKLDELNELFPIFFIRAERRLGEDGTHDSSLASLISEYFETNEDELDPRIVEQVILLRNLVEDNSRTIQQKSDEILSELVSNAVGFGYPNGEELQLGVQTELSVDEQIINKAQLTYNSEACEGRLPSTHNGLGYKNLIKMEFLLAAFAKSISACGNACMPLLFIEEPESHMHPQMQRAFAEYLEEFLEKIASMRIQTVLTTHSAHIANTMDFPK